MALSERLAYLITANVDDAVRGFGKVGRSANEELGKAEKRIDRFGGHLTSAGAGMLAFAGVAAGGLAGLASQSEEANRSLLLIRNTLSNMPALAGENEDSFVKLAQAIQSKTAADGDQILAAEAMLGTFRVTGEQIRQVTPLVVDFARKFKVDLTSAAVQVGKALDGQIGALKRNGVSIDENLFKTDRYAAVLEALREQVGGFAEDEGKTFSGSLQRLRNEMGDLAEGVGVGVVEAFSSAIKPATAFSDWLGRTNPEAQRLTGRLLAIGTGAVGTVGAMSLITGQLIKMRGAFTATDAAGARTLSTLGKFGAVVGIAATAAALWEVQRAANAVSVDVEKAARATSEDLAEGFLSFTSVVGDDKGLKAFRKMAEESLGTATRLRDELKRQGEDVSDLDAVLKDESEAQRRANRDMQSGADAAADYGSAVDDASESLDTLAERLDAITESAFGIKDAQDEAADAIDSLLEKAERSGKERARAEERVAEATEASARRIRDAEEAVADAREEAGKVNVPGAEREAALKHLRAAEEDLADARAEGADSIRDAQEELDEWKPSLDRATQAGRDNRDLLEDIVEKAIDVAKKMEEQKRPAREISAELRTHRTHLEEVGAQLGFNKEDLEEFLALLREASLVAAPANVSQPFATKFEQGIRDDRRYTTTVATPSGGVTINLNAPVMAKDEWINELARTMDRQLRRRG